LKGGSPPAAGRPALLSNACVARISAVNAEVVEVRLEPEPGLSLLLGNGNDPLPLSFSRAATEFQVLDAITTFEDSKYAYQSIVDLLHHTPDLVATSLPEAKNPGYCADYAKTRVGLRVRQCGRSGSSARGAGRLLDGVIDVIVARPIKLLAETTVELLANATAGKANGELVQRLLPFENYAPENL
jgi:hypothetical protein